MTALTKNDMKPSFTAVLFLEAVLVTRAQFLHRRQIDLIEGREQRLRRLRLYQPFGDARAQARHRHALFDARPISAQAQALALARNRAAFRPRAPPWRPRPLPHRPW